VCGSYLQARSRGRAADEAKQHGECAQHVSRPSRRDLAEQAMLDGIPLRRSRRIVADGDFQSGFVREILKSLLETPRPSRVAPSGIRLDHQTFCPRIIRPMQTPPVGDGVHGQGRRVARSGHAHMALVSLRIVNSVLRRATFGVLGKVVGIDFLCFFPPRLPDILEMAHQFFLLGVHADSRVAHPSEFFAFFGDIAELSISLGVRLARVQHLAMAAQTVALLPQQATDGGGAGPAIQRLRQASQPRPHPFFCRAGIAGGFRFHQSSKVRQDCRIFFSTGGRPPPGSRTRSVGRPRSPWSSSSRPMRMVSGCSPVISATC